MSQQTQPTKIQRSHNTSQTKTSLSNVSNGLGTILSWSFNGRSWQPETLRKKADELEIDWMNIKDVPVTNGMHNAVALFRDVSVNDEPVIADKVHSDKDAGLYTFAILERKGDSSAKKSKYTQIDSVTYDVNTKSFLSSGKTKHAQKLIQAINFRVDFYTGNEYRKWIIMPSLERWKAIRIMGGCYYVNNKFNDEVNKLEKFCDHFGVSLKVLDQMNTPRTVKCIGDETKKSLMERISDVNEQLVSWKGRKRIRKDGSDKVLSEIAEILDTAKMLRDCLSVSYSDIQQAVKDAAREALDLIKNQSVKPVTSKKVLQTWKNAMKPIYQIGTAYVIPFADFEELCLPETAKQKHYYKKGQRICRVLLQLGFVGKVDGQAILLQPCQ